MLANVAHKPRPNGQFVTGGLFSSAAKKTKVWMSGVTVISLVMNMAVALPAKAALEEFSEPAIAVIGQTSFTAFDAATSQTGLTAPYGVAYDADNMRIFVADVVGNRVLVYDVNPGTLSEFGEPAIAVIGQPDYDSFGSGTSQTTLSAPSGLAYDPDNMRLFVADDENNRVTVYDVDPGTLSEFGEPAIAVIGQADYDSAVSSVSQTGLTAVVGVSYDAPNQRLFVSAYDRGGVTVYDVNPGTLSEFGEPAIAVIGQPSYTSFAGTTTQIGLNNPLGTAYDATNERLFVADSNGYRVTVYDVDPGTLSEFSEPAIAVLGQANYTSNGPALTQTGMGGTYGVEYDPVNERLFVSNIYFAARVTVYDVDPGTLSEFSEPAIAVIGQTSYTSAESAVTQTGLTGPYLMAYDAADERLFIADGDANRVMVYDFGTFVPTTSNNLEMSRLKAGEVATVYLSFDLSNTLSSTLTVTFPSQFTVLSAALANPESSACLSNFQFSNVTKTVSADKTSCGPGTIVLGGFTVQNPAIPGSYTISWVNDDPGEAIVAIVDDDQVTVNATVDPSITFDLDTGIAAGETGAPYSVALGALTIGAVSRSDNATVNSIFVQLSTNATDGALVTVLSANAALESASVPTDTIPNAAGPMAAGAANYGICVNSVSAPTAANGTFQRSAPYDTGACDPAGSTNAVKALSTVVPTNILDSNSNPVTAGAAEIIVNAAISTSTAAHSDYSDTLTFVATGTF